MFSVDKCLCRVYLKKKKVELCISNSSMRQQPYIESATLPFDNVCKNQTCDLLFDTILSLMLRIFITCNSAMTFLQ